MKLKPCGLRRRQSTPRIADPVIEPIYVPLQSPPPTQFMTCLDLGLSLGAGMTAIDCQEM